MNIVLVKTGAVIGADTLLSSTLRTDCVPVPATLEMTLQSTPSMDENIVVGAELLVGDPAIPMTIIKVQTIKTQLIKEGRRIGGIACVAILSGCQRLIEPVSRAVILSDTSVLAAMRACGAKIGGSDDISLSRFVCLVGQIPTVEIAKRLQQEGAIVMLKQGRLCVKKIDSILKSEPVAKYDYSAITMVNSPAIQALSVPSYLSLSDDGSNVQGTVTKGRPVFYQPRLDSRQLNNLERVLIHRGSMMRTLDERLNCGVVVQVGDEKMVILTAAHRIDTGALGGNSVFATKVWLSSL